MLLLLVLFLNFLLSRRAALVRRCAVGETPSTPNSSTSHAGKGGGVLLSFPRVFCLLRSVFEKIIQIASEKQKPYLLLSLIFTCVYKSTESYAWLILVKKFLLLSESITTKRESCSSLFKQDYGRERRWGRRCFIVDLLISHSV